MWKLPNGRTITWPRSVRIGDVNYPAQIFRRWSKAQLKAIGIFPFREIGYDSKYYRSTGSTDIETDHGEIVRLHTTTQRYTNKQMRGNFADKIKQNLMSLWNKAKGELEYLNVFDNTSPDIAIWLQYNTDLKDAALLIKDDFMALTDYEEGITFISEYTQMLPAVPFTEIAEEEPIV